MSRMSGTPASPERPITVLIAALGGEGGGVLTGWLVAAAERSGLAVQSTSIPGVAQRTGATTYYIEMLRTGSERRPVFALTPAAGEVDLMVASELLEAARAVAGGFVSPERTTVIASTHRIFARLGSPPSAPGKFPLPRRTTISAPPQKHRPQRRYFARSQRGFQNRLAQCSPKG